MDAPGAAEQDCHLLHLFSLSSTCVPSDILAAHIPNNVDYIYVYCTPLVSPIPGVTTYS
jgi:hypothetical protein